MKNAVRKLGLAVVVTALVATVAGASARRFVYVLTVDGVILPPVAAYIQRGIRTGEQKQAQAVIVRIKTPGGLDKSMRDIMEAELNAEVPVVIYVSPVGARCASAGALIALASHVAAMAPGTNIGAAHPVAVGGGEMTKEMKEKVENDAASTARSIANRRGRNAKWAEDSVRKSISSTPEEALKAHVIDIIAEDMGDLLKQLDGRKVKLRTRTVTLHTANAQTDDLPMSMTERFLHILTYPDLALIFLAIGFYGIIFELQSPGAILPGVVGAICLVLGFYSLAVLEANVAGVILIVMAMGMLVIDLFVPSHGALTVGGIVAFAVGSLMLFGGPTTPFLRVSLATVIMMTAFTGAFFLLIAGLGVRAHWVKVQTGREELAGARGKARTALRPEGSVLVKGELWRALGEGEEPIEPGDEVEVISVDGLTLHVRRR